MQSSSMVRWETTTKHFATSITDQMNASMIQPPPKSNQGKHLSPLPTLEMGSEQQHTNVKLTAV
jgi:hypothetical protein